MNKNFLLIAIIIALIAALNSFLSGIQILATDGLSIINQIPGLYDELVANDLLSSVQNMLSFLAVISLIISALNVYAAFVLIQARNGKASSKKAFGWSIYLLFGGGLLAGLFGILGSKEKKDETGSWSDLESKLRELENLYEKGLITKEEYDIRRENIINKI